MSNNPVRIFDSQGRPLAVTAVGDGTYKLQVDTEISATIDPSGLSTSAKQDAEISKLDSIIAALAQLAAAGDKVIGEVLTGTPNGVLTTFTTSAPFVANSEEIKVNGISQARTIHYTPTGSIGQVVFLAGYVPQTSDILTANYWKA